MGSRHGSGQTSEPGPRRQSVPRRMPGQSGRDLDGAKFAGDIERIELRREENHPGSGKAKVPGAGRFFLPIRKITGPIWRNDYRKPRSPGLHRLNPLGGIEGLRGGRGPSLGRLYPSGPVQAGATTAASWPTRPLRIDAKPAYVWFSGSDHLLAKSVCVGKVAVLNRD